MQARFAAVLMTFIAITGAAAYAGSKADKKTQISFHMETENSENPKMIFQQEIGGGTRYFRRTPEVSTKDIIAFSPFPSESGGDYGVVFKLKDNAARRLSAVTSSNQGRWMITMVNGRPVDGVFIDKQIDDGIIVAWKGVTMADVTVFDESMPRIGKGNRTKK